MTQRGQKIDLQQGEVTTAIDSAGKLSITIPIRIQRRSGRKTITLPHDKTPSQTPASTLTAWHKALAKGFQWLDLIETGKADSIKSIAQNEKIDPSYVSRMINLTMLHPQLIARMLDGHIPDHLTIFDFAVNPALDWIEQTIRWETLKHTVRPLKDK